MLKFFKKKLVERMEEDHEQFELLDLLEYHGNLLVQELSPNNLSIDEQNEILRSYLRNADLLYKPIPDFEEDLDWFNVTEPLSLTDSLSGKVVLLDFFTYCCINCMHCMPDLRKIEDKYSVEDGLVVIGVHSAKFANEKDSANLLSAVQRYNITHPVVNDYMKCMWSHFNLECWPSFIILGPRGNPLFVLMGQGNFDSMLKYISAAIQFYKEQNAISNHSLPLNPAADLISPNSILKFPGKITCSKSSAIDPTPELYAISDSGNNRIIIITPKGEVLHKIGGKQSGFVDGDLRSAKFHSPQGLSFLNENILFVADTENHAVRRIDLKENSVTTIAGTGIEGNDIVGGKIGTAQAISSPWDVAVYQTRDMDMSFHLDENLVPKKNIVFVASAGTHQIWTVFADDVIWWKFKKYTAGTVVATIGNGTEENRNNSYPNHAAFAQPSGLAIGLEQLFIADSESSTVRKVSLVNGKVSNLVGGDRNPKNLFAYGDVDGIGVAAKLQHPLGVVFNLKDNSIYVADSYNHKIKRINIATNQCDTCNIFDDSKEVMIFNEPGGLCSNPTGEFLYVANTNNHSIDVVDLNTMISKPLTIAFSTHLPNIHKQGDEQILELSTIKLNTRGGELKFSITLNLTTGVCVTADAPQKWKIQFPNEEWLLSENNCGEFNFEKQPLHLHFIVPSGDSPNIEKISVAFQLNLCTTDVCFTKMFTIRIPVLYDNDGLDIIKENYFLNLSQDGIQL